VIVMRSTKIGRLVSFAAGIALLGGVLAACGEDNDGDSGGASPQSGGADDEQQAQFCDDVSNLRASLSALGDLGPDSTVEDFKEARDRIADDIDDVQESARELGDTRVDELDSRTEELRQELDDLDEDTTLREAAQTIRDALSQLSDEGAALFSGIDCDGTPNAD
jgi:hypothetical protein